MSTQFKPNALTFNDGVRRLETANSKAKYDFKSKITTSLDPQAKQAIQDLIVSNVPGGFVKYQLPFFFDHPTQQYVSIGAPNTEVPEHSHDEGDGLRYIVAGSIVYGGKELKAGDWMFIPAKAKYSFKVGSQGVTVLYCYACCCA